MVNKTTEATSVTGLTGVLTNGLEKGQMAAGEIVEINQGDATTFMNPEQIERRQVRADEPFVGIKVALPDSDKVLTQTMKDYTRIGAGGIPANSTLGKIMAICTVEVGKTIPLMARDVDGRDGSFVWWEIAI